MSTVHFIIPQSLQDDSKGIAA